MIHIQDVQKDDYPTLIEIWEDAVRATHHFLKEEDIQFFKPLILSTYFDAVSLRKAVNQDNQTLGFLGIADGNIEMLFIQPEYRGQKIGKQLLEYAIQKLGCTKVDVNEQNEQAVGFYLHCGFKQIGRSELDPTGKPYPILHLELA